MKEVTGPVYIRYSILDWPLDRPFYILLIEIFKEIIHMLNP